MDHPTGAYSIFFTSLANPNRLQIINVLRQGRKNVTQLCKATGFEQTMISHNLKRLERCGMVMAEQKGKFRYYSLNKETIKPLMSLIDSHMKEYCCKILEEEKRGA
ncbi:winged helix-turn-helix transcriptional regulator [Candidatus Woesearchaeota archaeon]|nr:winged helix-turn-helix transcriptional regulator [Candidatus Woesearchaeota archaeon]